MTSPVTPVTLSTTPSERRIQICFGRRHLLRQSCVTDEEFFVATNLHLFFDALVDFDADLIFTSGLKKISDKLTLRLGAGSRGRQ